ncbi:hypothetical protein FRC06_011644 [Ceratobasidium sp. 370]|nr:hypothetical protein FRC06_011644 [Ceratobasidium sp. 370]
MGFDVTETTNLHDDFARTDTGYSVFNDHRNSIASLSLRLASAMFKHRPGYLARGVHTDENDHTKITWNEENVARWLDHYDEAVRRLALLTHVLGGSPSRGVETCLAKLVNMTYRVRNWYVLRPGVVVCVLLYGKGGGNTGYDTAVAHALPWRVGRLFLALNALARPLAGLLVERVKGAAGRRVQETSAYPIDGRELRASELSLSIRRFCQTNFGANIGIRALRHYLLAAQKKFLPEAATMFAKILSVVDAQAGHTGDTAAEHYAIDASERHLLADDTVLKYVLCSMRWANVLVPDLVYDWERALCKEIGDVVGLDWAAAPVAPASAPLLDTAALASALVDALREPLIDAVVGRVRDEVVQLLNERLPLAVLPPGVSGPVEPLLPKVPVDPKHLVLLRRFTLDPRAVWTTTGQAQAVVHVLRRASSLLAVLPTGAGKSFLFASLPLVEPGITVVVFPLRALTANQVDSSEARQRALAAMEHCRGRDLTVRRWTENLDGDGLVAVSTETIAENANFRIWMDVLIAQGRLNRIVLDEAHLIVTSNNYRSALAHLCYLTSRAVPLVALTATLPPSLEGELRKQLGFPTWRVVREPTQRPNIDYHVARYRTRDDAQAGLTAQLRRFGGQLAPGQGMMVVCRTPDEVDRLVGELGQAARGYHRQMDQELAALNLNAWLDGSCKTLVGTSALGTGVHHPSCRAVLHMGPPWGMTEYVQESGRAGRDGLPAVSILFDWPGRPGPARGMLDSPAVGWSDLVDVLEKGACIRLGTSSWIDGSALAETCSGGPGFRPCGRCVAALGDAETADGMELAAADLAHQGRPSRFLVAGETPVSELPTVVAAAPPAPPLPPPPRAEPRAPTPGPSGPRRDVPTAAGPAAVLPMLAPPAPIGPQVLADARAAHSRAMEDVRRPDTDPRAGSPADPYCFEALLQAKSYVASRCPYCLFCGAGNCQHPLSECLACPEVTRSHWGLEGLRYRGQDLEALKTMVKAGSLLPKGRLCFYCWWPWHARHDHPRLTVAQMQAAACPAKETVAQVCWLYLTRADRLDDLARQFGLTSQLDSMQRFAQWMCMTHAEGSYKTAPYVLLNAHRVLLYLLFVDKKLIQYRPGVQRMT